MKLSLVSAAALGVVAQDTPVSKVTQLLKDLISDSEAERDEEKKVYDKYACFCKDTTKTKSDSIVELHDTIDQENANLDKAKADKDTAIQEYEAAVDDIQRLQKEMSEAQAQYDKELADIEAVILDLEKANSSLDGAIKSLTGSRPSLLAVKKTVKKALLMADALGMGNSKKIASFLELAPNASGSGSAEYEFKSEGIIEMLNNLSEEFTDKLGEANDEKDKLMLAHKEFTEANTKATDAAKQAKDDAEAARVDAETRIGDAEEALTVASGDLADDQLYLTDLTKSCELKGRTHDQRSNMRANELKALKKALSIIEGSVAGNDEVNKRALLNQQKVVVKKASNEDVRDMDVGSFSFVQTKKVSLLSTLKEQKTKAAIAQLIQTAKGMKSIALYQGALSLKASPFDKVKGLIQKLIERLTKEATEEATQKGYCDTELGKARKERDYRHSDSNKLNSMLQKAQADKKQNEINVERLTEELDELNADHQKTTENRNEEKAANEDTLEKAREGLDAVKAAIKVLKDFYKGEHGAGGAIDATVSFVQESPILADEEALGATPEAGAYKGNQAGGDNVIALLDVIKSDYERTVKVTTKDEHDAAADYVKFDRVTKSSIAAKETEKANREQDIETLTAKINQGFDDLATNLGLMDDQVKILQDLNPLCIDTGMSYQERKEKREKEIEALKTALCQLDGEGVEPEC